MPSIMQAIHARAQLPVLVAKLPVRLGETFESSGQPPRFHERRDRNQDGCTRENPLQGQQNPPYRTACNGVNRLTQYRDLSIFGSQLSAISLQARADG